MNVCTTFNYGKPGNKVYIWKAYSILHGKHILFFVIGVCMQFLWVFEVAGTKVQKTGT